MYLFDVLCHTDSRLDDADDVMHASTRTLRSGANLVMKSRAFYGEELFTHHKKIRVSQKLSRIVSTLF